MPVSDKIFQLYQRFYAQKNVLTEAPALTIDTDDIGVAEFPEDKALAEMRRVAGYLMSRPDLSKIAFTDQVQIVRDAYQGQPFWQELLFDYLDLTLDVEEARLKREGDELREKTEELMYELRVKEAEVEEIVSHFADKIKAAKFHVDASALIRNYLKMAKSDEKLAWKMLTSNPAYFSPIVARDAKGKQVLSPSAAIDENKRLGRFLATVKG